MTAPTSAAVSKEEQLVLSRPHSGAVSKEEQLVLSRPHSGAVSKEEQLVLFGPSALAPPPPGNPALPYRNPLLAGFAAHFGRVPFPGRRAHTVAKANAPVIAPPVHGLPYSGHTQLKRAIHNHFHPTRFPGRDSRVTYGGGVNLPAIASQIVGEALHHSAAGVRVSQLLAEALHRPTSATHIGQFVAEALYAQDDPRYVRAAEFVVEALVPYQELPVLPIYPALIGLKPDVIKRPKFSAGAGVAVSGREIRVGYWTKPQWEWELAYDILRDNNAYAGSTASDIKTLIGFFLAVYGTQFPFLFTDPDDCQVAGQVLGVGDGSTTTFAFQRTYGLGTFSGTENVGGVNTEEPLTLYLANIAQTAGFTINTARPCANYVQFAVPPAPGVAVTADFQFWYYCRLKDDSYDFNKFMQNLWETQKITIFSLKG